MNVLIVDDEPDLRRALRQILEPRGCSVTEAGNGDEALAQLERKPHDVVLLDILMPEMEGIEATQRMRRAYPDLKIITMSGGGVDRNVVYVMTPSESARRAEAGFNYLDWSKEFGATHTIAKPFSANSLLSLVFGDHAIEGMAAT